MAKARNKTSEPCHRQPGHESPEGLPLDDLRWLPSREVFARLHPQLGGKHVAEHDINVALRQNDLACLNRYRTPTGYWERRQVSFLCWAIAEWTEVGVRRVGRLGITPGQPISVAWCARSCLAPIGFSQPGLGQRGAVLYFWQPHLERLWPTIFPSVHDGVSASPPPSLELAPKNPRGAGAKPYEVWELYKAKFYLLLYEDDVPVHANINVSNYAKRLMAWGYNNFGEEETPEQASMRAKVAEWKPLWERLKGANK
jgi:hypothetical protein